ncbi:hypothetical protein [Mycolicibacterium madagascariense]|nr:hypothetical protein [Mycolicibacterium madagascariense]MCV7013817.1 hypothetical protein [Mycolicibacterium madagascariense]
MADTDVWDVVIEEPVDGTVADGDTDRIAIVKKTEVEARQAFAEAVSIADRYGYRSVELRRNGGTAERWPSTG